MWSESRTSGRADARTHQKLRRTEHVQRERLDAGEVDAELPVDSGTFYAGEDAQVGGEPGGVCGGSDSG